MKQWKKKQGFSVDPRVNFIIDYVRNKDRLPRAFDGIGCVGHAKATVSTVKYKVIGIRLGEKCTNKW